MWRLVIALGAALVGYGCTRSRDEGTPAPVIPVRPVQIPPPPPSRLVPDGFSVSSHLPPPVFSPNTFRSPAVLNCNRFAEPIAGPFIPDAKTVLETLRDRIIPLLTPHVTEMRNGNFEAVQRDTALTAALNGVDILLSDGAPNIIDTLGDWDNLNAARAYLNAIGSLRPERNPNSQISKAVRAWNNNTMTVRFKGFRFYRSEIPQGTTRLNEDPAARASDNSDSHFRIITPFDYGNSSQFPILSQCSVPDDRFTSIGNF